MRIQQWLTIAGASTLVAGTVACISLPNSKPVTILTATTTGVLGGILLASGERIFLEKVKEQAKAQAKVQARLQESTLAELTTLKHDLQTNSTTIAALADRISPFQVSAPVTHEHGLSLQSEPQDQLQSRPQQNDHFNGGILDSRKTVILYDIENLLKGYNDPRSILKNLSLKDILERIKQNEKVGQVLIQKAYANWSDSRLKAMHSDINSLGIDPILISGFSHDPKKNAADIELVVSAIDLAYIRPAIEVYVIVSGDGGFASLAKKLHEYGKTVIGCAYENSTSQVFQSLCDDFILIPDPEADKRLNLSTAVLPLPKKITESNLQSAKIAEPFANSVELETQADGIPDSNLEVNQELASAAIRSDSTDGNFIDELNLIRQQTPASAPEMIALTQDFLSLYLQEPNIQATLAKTGIPLSVVGKAIKEIIPTLKVKSLGFANLTKYMQYVCQGMDLCVATNSAKQKTILCLRQQIPSGFKVLPDDGRKLRWKGLDTINSGLVNQINQIKEEFTVSATSPIAATQQILSLYAQDPTARAALIKSGLELSVAKNAVTYIAPDLELIQFGFTKFAEYLQHVCQNTQFCVVKIPPSKVVLALQDAVPDGAVILPYLPLREVHSVETYQSILATDPPMYRFPPADELIAVIAWILEHPQLEADLRTFVKDIAADLGGNMNVDVVGKTLGSLVAANLFIRQPADLPLAQQQLTLLEHLRSQAAILEHLRSLAEEKLAKVLPTVDSEILDQLFPPQT